MSIDLAKRKNIRLKDFDYSTPGLYFITICTKNRRCMLSKVVGTGVLDGPQIELTEHGKIAEKYINQLNNFYEHLSVEQYVIMPNHIHLILWIKCNGPSRTPVPTIQNSVLSQFISTFKRFCNKEYGENIWQARSYEHIIRDFKDYETRTTYIYENPMRWFYDELYSEE